MTDREQRKVQIQQRLTALEQEGEKLRRERMANLPDRFLPERVRLLAELRELEGPPDEEADERPYPGPYMF